MAADARRMIAELRELAQLTADERGAQRLAWTDTWARAREWERGLLAELPVEVEIDEAGNQWATLHGQSPKALLIGSHIDSVPNGGWLDGCLGVLSALEVLRSLAADGRPPLTVKLVDWADEEGLWFGLSLLGSMAAAGQHDPDFVRGLRDANGTAAADALAAHGVDVDRMGESRSRLADAAGYIELHIEQGPVLEARDLPLGVVTGVYGTERWSVRFTGQAAHAGSTPMEQRRDALLAASRLALQIRGLARTRGGVGTVGRIDAEPGIPTAVAGVASALVDQRHVDADALRDLHEHAEAVSRSIAEEERVEVEWSPLFRVSPIHFDADMVAAAGEIIGELQREEVRLPSGPLHDAARVAEAGVPTVMLFVRSKRGLSHTREEDTDEADLELALAALERLVRASSSAAGENHLSLSQARGGPCQEAREAFERIDSSVQDMDERVQRITSAAAEIVAAGTQMQESIEQVLSVAETSSASAEEVSATTEQTSASAQHIASSAGELAHTADSRQGVVPQFKLS